MELLIERIANIYFWLFIIMSIINIIYAHSDEYKKIKEIKISQGSYIGYLKFKNLLHWLLFILSCYYR